MNYSPAIVLALVKWFLIRIILASMMAYCALYVFGCAHQQLSTPSGAGVASAVGRTQISVEQAKRYNDVAVVHNANAQTRVQRIEAKAEVIQKYWDRSK